MTVRTIAVLDLWTDANRGDEALQAGLFQLLRDAHPGARLTGVFRFGTNEIERALPEIRGSVDRLDEALGGLRRTQYAAGLVRRGSWRRAVDLLSFVEALACLIAFRALGDASRWVIGSARHRTLVALCSADVVVWKGKNFRDYRGASSVTRALTLTSAAWFAGWLRRELHCVNASFWPIRSGLQARLYRSAFRKCASVTVRERSSVEYAKALLGPRVTVRYCPDLSFAVVGQPLTEVLDDDPIDVALTVTGWGSGSEQDHYLQALEDAVISLSELGASSFAILPQVIRSAEDSSQIATELQRRVAAKGIELAVIGGPLSIDQLRGSYARARMLVGTRMHSCVFARSVGTPFVAVSYDSGPKWEVLGEFWPSDLIVDYSATSAELIAACLSVWLDGSALVEASQPSWDKCIAGVGSNMDFVRG